MTNDAELNLDDAAKLIIVASTPPGSGSMIAGDDFVRRSRLLRSRLSLRRVPSGKNNEEERGETASRGGSWYPDQRALTAANFSRSAMRPRSRYQDDRLTGSEGVPACC